LLASVTDLYERYKHSGWPEIASVKQRGYDYKLPLQYSDLELSSNFKVMEFWILKQQIDLVSKDKKADQYGTRGWYPIAHEDFAVTLPFWALREIA